MIMAKNFSLNDLLPYVLFISYNFIWSKIISMEVRKYPVHMQQKYFFRLNYENVTFNKPEDIGEAIYCSPLHVLISIAGIAPVSQRLGLFYKNKLEYSSKRITRVALIFIVAFVIIVGVNRVLQMNQVVGSEEFLDRIETIMLNFNNYEKFPISLRVESESS